MSVRHELAIVGTGVSPTAHLTEETRAVLAGAEQIATIIQEPVERWLPVAARHRPIHDLYHLYRDDRERRCNYEEACARVVDLALTATSTVLVCPGAPNMYDRLVTLVAEAAIRAGLRVRIYPAVSSLEGCLALMGEDMAPGLQVHEVRWFMRRGLALNVEIAGFFVQPGAALTDRMPTLADASPENLAPWRERLLEQLPPEHPIVFVRAPYSSDDEGYLRVTRLGQACEGTREDLIGTSIYVPALNFQRFGLRLWHRHLTDELSPQA